MGMAGKVVVVTGSAVGIGRALCVGLAGQGADVVAIDVDEVDNGRTAEAVRDLGRRVVAVTADIADAGAVKAVAERVARELGPTVHLLVNNAARWNDTRLTAGDYDTQVAAFHAALGSCATGAFHCTAAFLPMLRAAGGADVVNMLTDHVLPGHFITGAPATGYDCAKFALWRLTESWAVELKPHRVRVNGLAFGATDTPMLRAVSVPLAEAGMRPADLVQAVLNVLAHGPDGPTGQVHVFGMTREPREQHLAEIAAIAPAG